MKLLNSLFFVVLQTFFTERVLKEKLDSQRALQRQLTTRTYERNLGTRALKALGHSIT